MASPLIGHFVWYDLMTSDTDAAQTFYTDVIGWTATPWEGSDEPYTMWAMGEKGIGGLATLPAQAKEMGAPPHWLAYAVVEDVAGTVAKATELGGKVYVQPTDIPNVGCFAVIADPQGAVFAAYKPSGEMAVPGASANGDFSWHELYTSDWEAAWGFYEALFGWRKTDSMDMGPMGTYQMFAAGERTLGGMMNKPAEMPAPPHWLYYTTVADVDAAVERAKVGGGTLVNGPMDVPGGDRVAMLIDPQGAGFALHQNKPA